MTSLDNLITRFKNKEVDAFEKLYEMYSDSIYGVIMNIVRNEEMATELLQDSFLKAWNNAETYNSKKGRFFTWMLNIARNSAIDKTRSKAFKQSRKNLDSSLFVDIIPDHENLDNKTDAIGIKNYVKALGETCKQLIELLYFKGFTHKEAAEELGNPIGTIKTRNRNCIKQLRDMVL
ncbi:RNA polymerase sigma-70 factor [Nonlabens tegetincola]|uniref:RNA polymerase sigma-70 factor n=1 Tax=Nonlabens tegetincola TaxID=323273 RepID=A0A090QLG1_9FLAO|nr:sigma-70 family RNA polymerase sigma factor [Nonlabens tegetincola]ARN71660.1 RNA polymerase subunit sigma-70 [Nonlabens tegetincola]GAK96356.1 RNA polymerase sigma-70 factor [Nonlabens tegetincola]